MFKLSKQILDIGSFLLLRENLKNSNKPESFKNGHSESHYQPHTFDYCRTRRTGCMPQAGLIMAKAGA